MVNELDQFIIEYLKIDTRNCLPFVSFDRTFTRERLPEIFNHFGYTYGAEVGVRKGHYSWNLCSRMKDLHLVCIDPYAPSDEYATTQKKQDNYFEDAKAFLKEFDVTFIRKTSMSAVDHFKDNELDFVYIDALHDFDNVMKDMICWTRKVRKWGIIAGHDYVEWPLINVVNAVRSYTYAHNIYPWYLTHDGCRHNQAIHSWFFVKSWS